MSESWVTPAVVAAGVVMVAVLWRVGYFRSGSLDGKRDVSGHPAFLWLAGAFVVFAGVMLGVAGASLVPGLGPRDEPVSRSRAVTGLSGYVSGLVMGWVMVRLVGGMAPGAGLRVRWGDVARGVVAFLVSSPVLWCVTAGSVAVAAWISGRVPETAAHPLLVELKRNPGDVWTWVSLGSAVVVVPAVEEVMYRGFLQSGLARVLKSRWSAVVAASGLFAAAHVAGSAESRVAWHALPTLFALGVAMGSAFERTGRLGVPIVMHMLFNGVNTLAFWMSLPRG